METPAIQQPTPFMVLNTSSSSKQEQRRVLLAAVVRYLGEDGLIGLSVEDRESVEVAIQCISSVYGTNSVSVNDLPDITACLNTLNTVKDTPVTVTSPADKKEQAEALKNEGNKFLASGKPAQARDCYEEAIQLDPSNPVFYSNLAAALTALGDYEEAVEASQTAVDLDPDYAKAWSRLGTALKQLGRREEALEAYQQCLLLDPSNDQTLQAVAQLQESGKKKTAAAKGGPAVPSNLADMMKGMDINKIMSDPNFMQMANQMLESGALDGMMKNLQQQKKK